MKKKVQYLLFGFLALLLMLPLLQQQLKVVDSGRLTGVVRTDTATTDFSLERWMDGSFQLAVNNKVQSDAGFRPDFIRLKNQIDYSLFKKRMPGC